MIAWIIIGINILIYLIGIFYVILIRDKYKAELGFAVILIVYSAIELMHFIAFNLAVDVFYVPEIAKIIWLGALNGRIVSIALISAIHTTSLHKNSKIRYLPVMLYLFLIGAIMSLLYMPDSFIIQQVNSDYLYRSNEIFLTLLLIIFNFFAFGTVCLTQIRGYKNYSTKELAKSYSYYVGALSLNIVFYLVYLLSMSNIYKYSYIIIQLITTGINIYIIITKPELVLVFTNKIYDFIIFHKSGILLYSYDFQTGEEVNESSLKGSILIGINHILANLSTLESQLTHIKMSERAIVFNFNKEFGYATLLVAKHKNPILEKSVENFMNKFSHTYKDDLKNLSGLIDISIFKNTKELIHEIFRQYSHR